MHCFAFLFGSNQPDIEKLYQAAEVAQKDEQNELNEARQQNRIDHENYERQMSIIERRKRALQRDKAMAFGSDRLNVLTKKIRQSSEHPLFDEDVYQDFKRRLSPPEHTLKQGITLNLDSKQTALSKSKSVMEKVKGVAGCGKTTILAQRAIDATNRHADTVLILTFNITLKNYIRDKISDLQGNRNFRNFEISNYHQFYISQINNSGQDIVSLIEKHGLEGLFSKDLFADKDTPKYKTILLDEIQDYQTDWVKIVRNNFVADDGEMVLFGDESQNIYHRVEERASVVAQGFGRWAKLSRSYRTNIDSPLNQLFKDFQIEFLAEKYTDAEIFETKPTQIAMGFSLLKYDHVHPSDWRQQVFESIEGYIRSYDLHPNDIVILGSRVPMLIKLSDMWTDKEKAHCMFETYDELLSCMISKSDALKNSGADVIKKIRAMNIWDIKSDDLRALNERELTELISLVKDNIEHVRRAKKNHFYANTGLLKFSTIHSFKGLESKTVFYILGKDDDPEVVYTSITRSTENLVIFDVSKENLCSGFFEKHIV